MTARVTRISEVSEWDSTNRTWVIDTDSRRRFVVREYKWPYEEEEPQRAHKETTLHQLLRQQGIPVPEVLTTVREDDWEGVLLEYLPGQPLGDVTSQLTSKARAQAWRSVGEVIRRVHSINYPTDEAGVIIGDKVRPFDKGSWGAFFRGGVSRHAARLRERRPDLAVDLDRLKSLGQRFQPLLDDTPRVLLHNDPHPWNVLVHETEQGWECSAVLDWEHAWVGDPTWDLVRMDLFRLKPIGPTPEAFWEGYGHRPIEPQASFYELHISLWMANQHLDGSQALPPTYEAATDYVHDLERHLSRLEDILTA